MSSKRVLGISEEVTTCECCGRTGLKSTVIVGTEDGEAYYGSTCASYFVHGKRTSRDGAKIVEQARAAQIKIAHATDRFVALWTIVDAFEDYLAHPKTSEGFRPFSAWCAANKSIHGSLPTFSDLENLIKQYSVDLQG